MAKINNLEALVTTELQISEEHETNEKIEAT